MLSYVVPGTDARAPQFPSLLAAADPAFSTPPSITVFSEDFETMFAHQASLSLERQLTDDLLLSVGYSYWAPRCAVSRDINLGPVVSTLDDGRPVFTDRPTAPTRPSAPSTSSRASVAATTTGSTSASPASPAGVS